MIGYLSGTLLAREDDKITIIPSGIGIGYEVFAPASLTASLVVGEPCALYIYCQTTEALGQTLFGFRTLDERAIFRKLVRVSGIEPVVRAIGSGDDVFFCSIPGIGKKLSRKIIAELHE